MVVGTLEVDLRLDSCFSLKDKRRVVQSLIERARTTYRVSISEVGDNELWNVAVIGVAYVTNNAAHAESVLQHVLDLVDANPLVSVEGARREIIDAS